MKETTMRALLCLALVSSTALAATPISRGDAAQLKDDIAGQYRLETGRDVRLTLVDDRLYLDLNRNFRKELLPVAQRTLASRGGRLTVEYMPDGPVDRILIKHPGLGTEVRLGEANWRGR
jgi:hypothetical protein